MQRWTFTDKITEKNRQTLADRNTETGKLTDRITDRHTLIDSQTYRQTDNYT